MASEYGRQALLTTEQAANYLNLSSRTLRRMRADGAGPSFVRATTRLVRYRQDDLEAWQRKLPSGSSRQEAAQ